jgi:class 3 adenylate cyclase
MPSQTAPDLLARYLPRILLDYLAARVDVPLATTGGNALAPHARPIGLVPADDAAPGALLLADISGFTGLAERLAERGAIGAEELSEVLNECLSPLVAAVATHGGDVLKFAGDALIAFWRARAPMALEREVDLALRCASEIQQAFHHRRVRSETLAVRIAVGAGETHLLQVGGLQDRWEFVVCGSAAQEVGEAIARAARGEVVVGPRAAGFAPRACARDGAPDAPRASIAPAPSLGAHASGAITGTLPAHLAKPMRAYLPAALLDRLDAGLSGYVGELRVVSILFVHLSDLCASVDLVRTQHAMEALQRALAVYEGSVNKLSTDDKGAFALAVFGLPPRSHEDDPSRAVLAALAMQEAFAELEQPCRIGVATGRVYCGEVGSETRREYTMIGDSVNLSARLMQGAHDGILCDELTCQRARNVAEYAPALGVEIRGKARAQRVYRVLRVRHAKQELEAPSSLLGRAAEREQLTRALRELVDAGRSGAVVVEGEAGIGKSRVVADFLETARLTRADILYGAASAIDQSTSYGVWRNGLLRSVGPADSATREEAHAWVFAHLGPDARRLELAPLIEPLLSLQLEESALTAQMSGEVRAGNTHDLVVFLLGARARRRPLVLVVEDLHWVDSASAALLQKVRTSVAPLLLVATSRPNESAEYARLLATPETVRMVLDRLSRENVISLVAQRLGVRTVAGPIADLIHQRAEGHPFFSEELCHALRDAGAIEVRDEEAVLAPGLTDLSSLDLPDTIEGIITSRIDRLSPHQQLTLKVASAIGRSFEMPVLEAVHPLSDRAVDEDVVVLTDLDLTLVESEEPIASYLFKHVLTQEVAYGLMLYTQREALHGRIARWYEDARCELGDAADAKPLIASHGAIGATEASRAALYPLLAHHWRAANVPDKALDYLERSSEHALRGYANVEAIDFICQALRISASVDTQPLRRARWHAIHGEASVRLGKLADARQRFERALLELGLPVPSTVAALAAGLVREIARQLRHRMRLRRRRPVAQEEQRRRVLGAEAYEQLFLIYFFAGDAARALHGAITAANLAESSRAYPPVLWRCFTTLGIAVGTIPLRGPAEHYLRRVDRAYERIALPEQSWQCLGAATYAAGVGRWAEVESYSLRGLRVAERLGDRRRFEELGANLVLIRLIRGHFDPSEDALYRQVLESGERREVIQAQGWGLCEWSLTLHALGRLEAIDVPLDRVERLIERHGAEVDEVTSLEGIAMLAHRALRRSDTARAHAWVSGAMERLQAMGRPSQYRHLPSTGYLAEVVLMLVRSHRGAADAHVHDVWLRFFIEYLRAYARSFPIGRPRLYWLRAEVSLLRDRPRRALRAFMRSAGEAARLAMPYDEARALRAASALLADPDAARMRERADEMLRQLGCTSAATLDLHAGDYA